MRFLVFILYYLTQLEAHHTTHHDVLVSKVFSSLYDDSYYFI